MIYRCTLLSLALLLPAGASRAQTVTVTTVQDAIDVNWPTATVADLPGPDGLVSLSEAIIATNNTPGHQTIAFAIPASQLGWFGPQYDGIAVFQSVTGFFWVASDDVTIDGTTQTAFAGDTNPGGNEVLLFGDDLVLGGNGSVLRGFHSSEIFVNGSNALIEGNTGAMNITLFGGSGSTVRGNECSTIKIDRSNQNVVIGNVTQRVRVLGWVPPAIGNRIGGPGPTDRNIIYGYGTYNSEGMPAGAAVQLFYTQDTIVENNWIGTRDGLTQGNLACTEGILLETQNDGVVIEDNLISGVLGHGTGPHHAGQLFGRGILASGAGQGLTITGNTIGPDVNGDPTLGSVWGLDMGDPVTHPLSMTDIVVADNEIAGHILNGVTVGRNTLAVRLERNSIHDNGWLGIDLVPSGFGYGVSQNDPLDQDTGGNQMQNFPALHAVMGKGPGTRVVGELDSYPGESFTMEFFSSPVCDDSGHGEGQTFLGATSVSTDAAGHAEFDVVLTAGVPLAHAVTATATRDALGQTSEFSECRIAVWTDLGGGTTGVQGDPVLLVSGSLVAASQVHVELRDAAPSAAALVFVSSASNPTPFLGGTLHTVPVAIAAPLVTDASGGFSLAAPFPGAPAGTQFYVQVAIADSSVLLFGASLSNGVQGTVP